MTDKEIAAFCLRCTKDSLDCPLAAGDYDRAVEMSCCRNQKRIVIEPECAENAKRGRREERHTCGARQKTRKKTSSDRGHTERPTRKSCRLSEGHTTRPTGK